MSLKCKKLVNSPEACVRENLMGFVLEHSPLIKLTSKNNIILRSDLDRHKSKVLLLSGSGSGHEPSFGGFVGTGMLSAAVAGEIFTSPTPYSVLAAIKILAQYSTDGILIIINNYTGDRLNFGLAMGRAKALGIKVEMLINHDDCALQSKDKSAGRRGIAGCLLAIKIAGAMAEEGKGLDEIYTYCLNVLDDIGTIAVALSGCSVPGVGSSFTLQEDEIELGLGIHGEAGAKNLKLGMAKDVVKIMIDHMTNPNSATCLKLLAGEKVALLLNNLGGTSQLEMNILIKETIEYLEKLDIVVKLIVSGTLMTALEMAGYSITIMKVDEKLIKYIEYDTNAITWPKCFERFSCQSVLFEEKDEGISQSPIKNKGKVLPEGGRLMVQKIALHMSQVIQENESLLNDLDRESGDGDCGSTLKRGFEAVNKYLQSNVVYHPKLFFLHISELMENSMGGSSGALYSIFWAGASQAFEESTKVEANDWKNALKLGLDNIRKFGGADPGDRTMVDPLHEFVSALPDLNELDTRTIKEAFQTAVISAEKSALGTSTMQAKCGRASYVDNVRLTRPDPGAQAVAIWLRAAFDAFTK